jgi:hypothetical protein
MRALGDDRIYPILMFFSTVKQLRAFLGVTRYYRIWIPGCADPARPFYQILKEAQKNPSLLLNGMTSQKVHSTS